MSRFTERQVVETLLQQGATIRCPRCRELLLLGQTFEREHFQEKALGGKDAVENCFYSHKACHAQITNGTKATTAGSSKGKIAKVRRIAAGGRKRKGPPIPSRPFPKKHRPLRPWRSTFSRPRR